jgi:hypothetical protein
MLKAQRMGPTNDLVKRAQVIDGLSPRRTSCSVGNAPIIEVMSVGSTGRRQNVLIRATRAVANASALYR